MTEQVTEQTVDTDIEMYDVVRTFSGSFRLQQGANPLGGYLWFFLSC
jgi:hypothetical protein